MSIARLATLSVVSVLLPVPLFAVNEETARRLDADTRAEAAAVQNMTVESSLHILQHAGGLHPDLSLIQATLESHHHRKHHNHHKRKHHLRHHREHSEQNVGDTRSGYAAVAATVQSISSEIAATQEKLDVENGGCSAKRGELEAELNEIDEGIATANVEAAKAQAQILKANKLIAQNERKIPEGKESLKTIREECESQKANYERDLALTQKDMNSLDNMAMSNCQGGVVLLQCEHPSGESFLMLSHHTTRRSTASQWQTPAVQRFLKDLSSLSKRAENRPVVFMQMEEHINPSKCAMEANPECQQVRDRYMVMVSDLIDNMDAIKSRQKKAESDCEQNVEDIEENTKNAQAQVSKHQTALAEATADDNEAQETARLQNDRRKSHVETMTEHASTCAAAIDEITEQKNNLLKARIELLQKQGLEVHSIQDCKVSDWTAGPCSKPCGKGERILTRDVLLNPSGDGAKCPATQSREYCNPQHCPVNCEMGEWGGWSACSAKCGGGVNERVRDIKTRSAHGGKPCLEASEAQTCNPQSCDGDCELDENWSSWSVCSKACDRGSTFQVKSVKTPATGLGKCPHHFSKKRLRMKTCNTQACLTEAEKDKSLKCNSMRDVVLLVDGSASLKTSGWEKMKLAAEAFVNAMGAEVNLATLLFSGPKTRAGYFKCTGTPYKGVDLGVPNLETECFVKWAHHFTTDKAEALTAVKAMEWPRGSSITAEVLAQAETELNNGRQDAQSVVVVLTPGIPLNPRKVTDVAKRVRRKARVMWVGVTSGASSRLSGWTSKWASTPVAENVIFDDFKDGFKKETLNAIVADMCPTIEKV